MHNWGCNTRPFATNNDNYYWNRMWNGLFKCPYRSTYDGNLVSTIGNFVRYFYIKHGQTHAIEASVLDMNYWLNPGGSNFIIVHGFNDGVRKGGRARQNFTF